jgi:hypothetical protein
MLDVGRANRGADVMALAVCIRADPNLEDDNRRVAMRAFDEIIVVSMISWQVHILMAGIYDRTK